MRKSSLLRMRWTASSNGSGGQLGAALAATRRQDRPARAGPHAQTEAVLAGTTTVVRLVGALAHDWFLTNRAVTGDLDRSGGAGSTATARSQNLTAVSTRQVSVLHDQTTVRGLVNKGQTDLYMPSMSYRPTDTPSEVPRVGKSA